MAITNSRRKLTLDISAGDLTLKAENVYVPSVPSAKVESPLLDHSGGYTGQNRGSDVYQHSICCLQTGS